MADVDDFIASCPPTEINADACVLGLFRTSDKAGKMFSWQQFFFFVCGECFY